MGNGAFVPAYPQLSTSIPGHVDRFRAGGGLVEVVVGRSYFHLHLVSDSTGETLIAASRAVSAQYLGVSSIEHVYPLVRSRAQLDRVIIEIETAPGIVLCTLVDKELSKVLETACREFGSPCLSVLEPIFTLFQSYLGTASTPRPGAQHVLNAEYFKRIDALNFTMLHDDGQQADNFEQADVLLVGVSRTSKTPTCIYLAHRGVRAANVPLVPDTDPPQRLLEAKKPLVVGLVVSPDRLIQIRRNRLLSLNEGRDTSYVDQDAVREETIRARRLFEKHGWPVIDVTRRSVEETAAAVINLLNARRAASAPVVP